MMKRPAAMMKRPAAMMKHPAAADRVADTAASSSTGGILAQASHVPRGRSQRPLILQFTN